MHRVIIYALLLQTLLVLSAPAYAQEQIKDYTVIFGDTYYGGKELLVTRQFSLDKRKGYIAVNPYSLETMTIPVERVVFKPLRWKDVLAKFAHTPYIKAIINARNQSVKIQDAGIIHGFPREKGVTLTIDLCPSHKPLDRVIFTALIDEFKKSERPVPLALSVTGKFLATHSRDIEWLKDLERSGDLSLTWINHTYNHYFNPAAPLDSNFLLKPGTDIPFEVLETELKMLRAGLMPSVFFRFPGLISDRKIVETVTNYGLIPVGSDAWLAKGQRAANGSIVLIHGNGNEPLGIKDFISLLRAERRNVLDKEWLMYDLRKSLADEFK